LPADVQQVAVKNFRLWRADPTHPSVRYRRLRDRENLVTARIGDHHRAVGFWKPIPLSGSGSAPTRNTIGLSGVESTVPGILQGRECGKFGRAGARGETRVSTGAGI